MASRKVVKPDDPLLADDLRALGRHLMRLSRWSEAEPPLRELTVGALLDEAVERWPDSEAVVFSAYGDIGIEARWSYAELAARARRAGRALIAAGIEPGDRFGIWATNIPEWLELQFGAAYAGAVVVPMNPLYRTSEVGFVLRKSGAAACFVLPENRGASLWEMAREATAEHDVRRQAERIETILSRAAARGPRA